MFGRRFTYFQDRLEKLERKASTAFKQEKKRCCRSGLCCWRRACSLAPGDEVKLAEFLDLTVRELFHEYLVVDTDSDEHLTVRPRRVEQMGGCYLTEDQTYDIDTPCIFLDTEKNNACKVHKVKPTEGRLIGCWMVEKDIPIPSWTRKQIIALGWNGSENDEE